MIAASLPQETVPAPEKSFDGKNLLPIFRGESSPQPRNLFWSAGNEEGWWAMGSGDWNLVGEKTRVGLFDLSQDVSEKSDIAKTMPDKVAELTKLHDVWLAEMANPVKASGKRYGMEPTAGFTSKKPKSERKKNQPAPSPKVSGADQ